MVLGRELREQGGLPLEEAFFCVGISAAQFVLGVMMSFGHWTTHDVPGEAKTQNLAVCCSSMRTATINPCC